MIEKLVPKGPRFRILGIIYSENGIKLSELIKKSRTSPTIVSDYIKLLAENKIVREEKIGGKKKVHIKRIYPVFDNETAVDIYSLLEANKRIEFFKKYRFLEKPLMDLEARIKNKASAIFIFGSYARFEASKTSDLDMFIITEDKIEKDIEEALITLQIDYSLHIESEKMFLEKAKTDPIHQNALKTHIIISGEKEFFNLLAKISL